MFYKFCRSHDSWNVCFIILLPRWNKPIARPCGCTCFTNMFCLVFSYLRLRSLEFFLWWDHKVSPNLGTLDLTNSEFCCHIHYYEVIRRWRQYGEKRTDIKAVYCFLVHLNGSSGLLSRVVCPSVLPSVTYFSHFQLLLWNRWTEFKETWQKARS